jgi:diguanylate cyclase (GGDEF)-like protein
VRRLAYLDLEEAQAADLWRSVSRHRRDLLKKLGRDVGARVALLDYLLNVRPRVVEPTIIEATALEALRRDAISDALTGLYNRQYFEEALRREVERCQRYDVTSSLLLLDLDEFKQINDSYGHCVGDEVLRGVGRLIMKHVRAADVPCRFGGDEFATILSDTPQAEAVIVAERIRTDVQSWFESTPVGSHQLRVSVSGGVATLPVDGYAPERLLVLADGALYDAKHGGANRIAVACVTSSD